MKKLVDGKIYDISSSAVVYEYSDMILGTYTTNPVKVVKHTIYKTRRGNYFKITKHFGQQELTPLKRGEVIRILEKNSEIALLKEYFSEYYSSLEEM